MGNVETTHTHKRAEKREGWRGRGWKSSPGRRAFKFHVFLGAVLSRVGWNTCTTERENSKRRSREPEERKKD